MTFPLRARLTLALLFLVLALPDGLLRTFAAASATGPQLAVLVPGTGPLGQPDITLFPPGLPKLQLTVDARAVPDAVENVKLPVGWVGSRLVAYASASGQEVATEPVYVQPADSPRRIRLATDAIAAAPSPVGAKLAILHAGRFARKLITPFSLSVYDATTGRTSTMILPHDAGGAFSGFEQGGARISWSADGTRVAAAWIRPPGMQVAACTVATRRCGMGRHTGDLGINDPHLTGTVSLGWINAGLLLGVDDIALKHRSALVLLNAQALRAPGIASGIQLEYPHVLALSVAPAGGHIALVEGQGSDVSPILQVVQSQGTSYTSEGAATFLGTWAGAGSGENVFASASSQSWTRDGRFVTYSDQAVVKGRYNSTVWRQDVITGQRWAMNRGGQWAGWSPSGPAAGPARSAGSCPRPPGAVTQSIFGFTPQSSVRQTVDYYLLLRQQAYRLADGSCLASLATGTPLSANVSAAAALARAGQFATTPLQTRVRSVSVNLNSATAGETVALGLGQTVYQGTRIVARVPTRQVVLHYGLHLKTLGTVGGNPVTQWVLNSLKQLK